jgi:hypothetical protein
MKVDTIDHVTLSQLVAAGAINSAHVVGQSGGWAITVKYGTAERMLAAQRSKQVRQFKRMETLVCYLQGIGISRFDVDIGNYVPETTARPDRAQALRQAHEAAAHGRWFRNEVEQSLERGRCAGCTMDITRCGEARYRQPTCGTFCPFEVKHN